MLQLPKDVVSLFITYIKFDVKEFLNKSRDIKNNNEVMLAMIGLSASGIAAILTYVDFDIEFRDKYDEVMQICNTIASVLISGLLINHIFKIKIRISYIFILSIIFSNFFIALIFANELSTSLSSPFRQDRLAFLEMRSGSTPLYRRICGNITEDSMAIDSFNKSLNAYKKINSCIEMENRCSTLDPSIIKECRNIEKICDKFIVEESKSRMDHTQYILSKRYRQNINEANYDNIYKSSFVNIYVFPALHVVNFIVFFVMIAGPLEFNANVNKTVYLIFKILFGLLFSLVFYIILEIIVSNALNIPNYKTKSLQSIILLLNESSPEDNYNTMNRTYESLKSDTGYYKKKFSKYCEIS